ncbi:nucleotidyl transferase AbiEii/AbiGii toxin family protein [Candidatus Micrarchaeota archaeon]|nr:nucleotidyl transferase AbiEii/AbiGii toxin family protein [Candidatus Micrarchaeota archaeon]MBI5177258.1 nucleotidyl transferase AbiEii/AbiGii toxin family protein [Candidatus Micrarchaeota archaeon]
MKKIRAIYHRPKPRDACDLAYLLENGIKPDYELIEEKLKPLSTSLEESSFEARLLLHEERRNRDLTQVVSNPPTFEETRNGTIGAPFRKDKT